ncbi:MULTISPECIES: phage tail protein [unclassified Pseudomonas]|uniref:phage tail protein n=1 Tax=unclassified Pseudomonas TaxID=196821 RepID=UPI002A367A19|nr:MULTISPECIES: phage tail protein [unclassified Pseudomonas]MDX9673130.1 phage tail protein [Pseudomonas sp. P8_250]WPN38327.1 phage tail protein [Pseudomonas sp. P8_139]WPN39871.1 phage tail protein [Pseudomonas sp. P8_229]
MLYSKSTGFFYVPAIHKDIPSDAVEISQEYYVELLDGQSSGKIIVGNDEGYPVLVDPPPPPAAELERLERLWRNAQIAATDSVVAHYRDEVERWPTLLTPAQYIELQTYRRALRIWPLGGELPLNEHRPAAPEWLASLPE